MSVLSRKQSFCTWTFLALASAALARPAPGHQARKMPASPETRDAKGAAAPASGTLAALPAGAPVLLPGPAAADLARALGLPDPAGATAEAAQASDGSLALLRDGTEAGRLAPPAARGFLEAHPDLDRALRDAGPPAAAPLTEAGADWKRWGEWPSEAVAGYDAEYLYSGTLVRRLRAHLSAFRRFGPLYLGGGLGYATFKGELPDSVPYAASAGHVGWEVSVGTDFLRYRLAGEPYALPEYFWAERDLEAKYFARPHGTRVVRLFDAGAGPGMAHTLEAKAKYLRYALTFAPGAYTTPLHYAALEDLPAGFGTWGLGALVVPGEVIPGLWFRFRDIELGRMRAGGVTRALRFSPGRLAYFRAVRSQFRLAWSGELALDL